MLKLVLFVLPLGLDTFAVSASLGLQGLPKRERLKVSLILSAFEMSMPIVGLFLGRGLGAAIGGVAEYVAAVALIGLGIYALIEDEEAEGAKLASLSAGSGLALIGLGVAVSVDELAMGFTIGLLHLSLVLAVILIGVQAFVFAQIGLRLGTRLGREASEWAERIAGIALIGLGILILAEQLPFACLEPQDRLFAVGRVEDCVTARLQHRRHDRPDRGVVFDDEDRLCAFLLFACAGAGRGRGSAQSGRRTINVEPCADSVSTTISPPLWRRCHGPLRARGLCPSLALRREERLEHARRGRRIDAGTFVRDAQQRVYVSAPCRYLREPRPRR